jgi:hypothetical protein
MAWALPPFSRNPDTRRAYSRAVAAFMTWCEDNGTTPLARAIFPAQEN